MKLGGSTVGIEGFVTGVVIPALWVGALMEQKMERRSGHTDVARTQERRCKVGFIQSTTKYDYMELNTLGREYNGKNEKYKMRNAKIKINQEKQRLKLVYIVGVRELNNTEA